MKIEIWFRLKDIDNCLSSWQRPLLVRWPTSPFKDCNDKVTLFHLLKLNLVKIKSGKWRGLFLIDRFNKENKYTWLFYNSNSINLEEQELGPGAAGPITKIQMLFAASHILQTC